MATGSKSFKVASAATSGSSYGRLHIADGSLQQWFRINMYFTANPGANLNIGYIADNTPSLISRITLSTAGKLGMQNSAGTATLAMTQAIPLNQWFRVEGYITSHATDGVLHMDRYDDYTSDTPTESQTNTSVNTRGTSMYEWQLGGYTNGLANIGPFWTDDIGVSSLGPIGAATSSDPHIITEEFDLGVSGATVSTSTSGNVGLSGVSIGTNATLTIDNTHAAHGSNSMKVTTGANSVTCYGYFRSSETSLTKWFRAYFYFTANPASYANLIRIHDVAIATNCIVQLDSTGHLKLQDSSGTTVTGTTFSTVIPLNQWFRVEGWIFSDATVGQLSLSRYDDMDSPIPAEAVTTAADVNTRGTFPYSFWTGLANGQANYGPVWVDDVGVSSAGPLGPGPWLGVALAGAGAAIGVAGGAGDWSGGAGATGVGAPIAVAGGAGALSAGVALTGAGAAVALAGGAGTRSAGAGWDGVGAPVAVAGGAGTRSAGAGWDGVGAPVAVAGGSWDRSIAPVGSLANFADGISLGVTPTPANSGGISGNAWDVVAVGANSSLVVDDTYTIHGHRSYKVSTGASVTTSMTEWTTSEGTQTKIGFDCLFYVPSGTLANGAWRAFQARTAGNQHAGSILFATNGTIQLTRGSSFSWVYTFSTPVPVDQWFRVRGYIVGDASDGVVAASIFTNPESLYADETHVAGSLNTTGAIAGYWYGQSNSSANSGPFWYSEPSISIVGSRPQDLGDPVFSDLFPGSAVDEAKWDIGDGYVKNNVTVLESNVAVSGGTLVLTLSDLTHGAEVRSAAYTLPVGGYVEAMVYFPGSGTDIYNWPAWWTSGPSWPAAGEIDIAEGLSSGLTINYHSPSGAHNFGAVPGVWSAGWHTFGVFRAAASADVYWDGEIVRTFPTDDNHVPEVLILTLGEQDNVTQVTGAGSQVLVEYVLAWLAPGVFGIGAPVSVSAGIGTASAGVDVTGIGAAVTVDAGAGVCFGGAGAEVTGVGAPVTVLGGSGTALGGQGSDVAGMAAPVTVYGVVTIPGSGAMLRNTYDGGSDGVSISHANSGGRSGDAFDFVGIGSGATLAYSNDQKERGPLSILAATTTANATSMQWAESFTAPLQAWFRCYLWFDALPAGITRFCTFSNAVGIGQARWSVTAAGKIIVANGANTTILTSAATIPTGAWFRVEGMAILSATVGQLETKLFLSSPDAFTPDETDTSSANQNTLSGVQSSYGFGPGAGTANQGPYYLDSVAVSDYGYIGPFIEPGEFSGGANVDGAGAAVGVACGAGTVSAGGEGNVTGVSASVAVAGGAGTLGIGRNLTGVGATVTVAGGSGAVGGTASVTGIGAAVTVAGGAGARSSGVGISGTGASVLGPQVAGTASGGAGVTGVSGAVPVAGGAGSAASGVGLTGIGAPVPVMGGAGVASGISVTNVNGVAAAVTVAGGAGTLAYGHNLTGAGAPVVVNGGAGTPHAGQALTGTGAAITVTAGIGAASGGGAVTGVGAAVPVACGAGTLSSGVGLAGTGAPVLVRAGLGQLAIGAALSGQAALIRVLGGLGYVGMDVPGSVTLGQDTGSVALSNRAATSVRLSNMAGSVQLRNQG